jgi:chromosome segregation ATPase
MSSSKLLEERIEENIRRQKEHFARQQALLNTIKSDILLADNLEISSVASHPSGNSFSTRVNVLKTPGSLVDSFQSNGVPLNVSQLSGVSTPAQALMQQQIERVRSFRQASEELQGAVTTLEQQVEALEEEKEAQKSSFVAERKLHDRQKEREKVKYAQSMVEKEKRITLEKEQEALRLSKQLKQTKTNQSKSMKKTRKLEVQVKHLQDAKLEADEKAKLAEGKLHATEEQARTNMSAVLQLREQLGKKVTRISTLEEKLGTEKMRVQQLQSKLDLQKAQMSEVDALRKDRLDYAGKIASLTTNVANEKRRAAIIPKLKDDIKRLLPLEGEVRSLVGQLKKMIAERDGREERMSKLRSALEKAKGSNTDLRRSSKAFKQTIETERNKVLDLEKTLAAKSAKLSELDSVNKNFRRQTKVVKEAQSTNENLLSRINSLNEEINVCNAKLKDAEDVPMMKAELISKAEEIENQNNHIRAYEEDQKVWAERWETKEAEHDAMREKLNVQTGKLRELTRSFHNQSTELAKAKSTIADHLQERSEFRDLKESVANFERREKEHILENARLMATISELEEVHRRVEITNRALQEAKNTIANEKKEQEILSAKVATLTSTVSSLESTLKNVEAAYVLAMKALVPALARNQELISQKAYLSRGMKRNRRMVLELQEVVSRLAMKHTVDSPQQSAILSPKLTKKLTFRGAAIAIIAVNRLLRFSGCPSALVPYRSINGSQQGNIALQNIAYHSLGEKIKCKRKQTGNAWTRMGYFASRYNKCDAKNIPVVCHEQGGGEESKTQYDSLLDLLEHFQEEKSGVMELDGGTAGRLGKAGLFVTPQVPLIDGLARGYNFHKVVSHNGTGYAGDQMFSTAKINLSRISNFVDELQSSRKIAQSNVEDLEKKLAEWQTDAETASGKLKATVKDLNSIKDQLASANEALQKLQEEKSAMVPQSAAEALKAELSSLKGTLVKLTTSCDTMRKKLKSAEKKAKDTKRDYDELCKAMEKQEESASEAGKNASNLKLLAAKYKRTAANYSARVKNIETKFHEALAKVDELQSSLNAAKRKSWEDRRQHEVALGNATRARDRRAEQMELFKERAAAAEEKRKSTEMELEALQEKYFEARKSHRRQMASVASDLSTAREESYPDVQNLHKTINGLTTQNTELRREMGHLLDELKSQSEDHAGRRAVLLRARDRAAADLEASIKTPGVHLLSIAENFQRGKTLPPTTEGINVSLANDNTDVDEYLTQIDKKLFEQYGTPYSARKRVEATGTRPVDHSSTDGGVM